MHAESRLTHAWLRALLPFHFAMGNTSRSVDTILARLQGSVSESSADPRDGTHTQPRSAYYLEYLPHVQRFLFDGSGSSGCVYCSLADERLKRLGGPAEVWLGGIQQGREQEGSGRPSRRGLQLVGVQGPFVWQTPDPFDKPNRRLNLTAHFDTDNAVELWLNRLGVGVLSLSLRCESLSQHSAGDREFFHALLQLNHALATAQKAVWLRTKDSAFHLHGLARDVLRPLWDDEQSSIEFELRGGVFTALETTIEKQADPEQDAARLAACQQELMQHLPHLAQLHPASHPGEIELGHTHYLPFNNEHLCFIDRAGAAHGAILRTDRCSESTEPASGYARNRLRRIQTEYFPGFLLAVIQRLCLQRILDESTAASALPGEEQELARQELLDKVLRFGLEGEFVQVAWRTTIQKHHELAQRAAEIHEGLTTVRHAMQDFSRMAESRSLEQQRAEAERAAKDRHHETERTERTMQVLEVFIVTFYSVELAHLLGESFQFGHTPFVAWSLVAVAFTSFGMASLLISWKWLQVKGAWWTLASLFLMASLIHSGFLGANAWWMARTQQAVPAATATPVESGAAGDDHGNDHH